jgi:hypothetical protein
VLILSLLKRYLCCERKYNDSLTLFFMKPLTVNLALADIRQAAPEGASQKACSRAIESSALEANKKLGFSLVCNIEEGRCEIVAAPFVFSVCSVSPSS